MKRTLKSIHILLLSIIYLLGSGVFFHTVAMENMMKEDMSCCESHERQSKDISSEKPLHCLGYEDSKLSNAIYKYQSSTQYSTLFTKLLDISTKNKSNARSLPTAQQNIYHSYNQKFLEFADLIGIIILLC